MMDKLQRETGDAELEWALLWLDSTFIEDSKVPSNFSNFRRLLDVFESEQFLKRSSPVYLARAKRWLKAFIDKSRSNSKNAVPDANFLASLNIDVAYTGWNVRLEELLNQASSVFVSVQDGIDLSAQHAPDATSKPKIEFEFSLSDEGKFLLNNYLERAKLMLKDDEVRSFCDEVVASMRSYFLTSDGKFVQNAATNVSGESFQQILPFWIICSSSGTGKSQIAYTLKVPAAYFLMHVNPYSTDQEIYQPFSEISEHFYDLFASECKKFVAVYPDAKDSSVKRLITCSKKEFHLRNPKQPYFYEFKTVGFIVSLFESMVELKSQNQNLDWLECELSGKRIEYKAMTVSEGQDRLVQLRSKLNPESEDAKLPLVIFLDECQLGGDLQKRIFRLVRNIIRGLRICFVSMGTNATACNFADGVSGSLSRETSGKWCHLIFNLPKTSKSVLQQIKEQAHAKFEECRGPEVNGSLDYAFIENFFFLFEGDRPLFVHLALDAIIRKLGEKVACSRTELFWTLMEEIYAAFCGAKKPKTFKFLIGQYAYFTAQYWNGISLAHSQGPCADKIVSIKASGELLFCRPALVTEHLAMVGMPKYLSSRYMVDLYVSRGSGHAKKSSSTKRAPSFELYFCNNADGNLDHSVFFHYSKYLEFNQEPVLGLSFSLASAAFPFERTALSAMADSIIDQKCVPYLNDLTRYNGHLLELATTTACIVSSHTNGFQGAKITEWLASFFNEMNFGASMESKASAGIVDEVDDFNELFGDIHIPYFCPQVSVEFSDNVKKKIGKIDSGCVLGNVNSNINEFLESRDFSFHIDGKTILNGECKLHCNSFSRSELNEVLRKFENLWLVGKGANAHIIVARSFDNYRHKEFPLGYIIYKAQFKCSEEKEVENESKPKLEPELDVEIELKTRTIKICHYSLKRMSPYSLPPAMDIDEQSTSQIPLNTQHITHNLPHSTTTVGFLPKLAQSTRKTMQMSETYVRQGNKKGEYTTILNSNAKCVILVGLEEIAQSKKFFNANIVAFKGAIQEAAIKESITKRALKRPLFRRAAFKTATKKFAFKSVNIRKAAKSISGDIAASA